MKLFRDVLLPMTVGLLVLGLILFRLTGLIMVIGGLLSLFAAWIIGVGILFAIENLLEKDGQ